jgi:hypothetical protein
MDDCRERLIARLRPKSNPEISKFYPLARPSIKIDSSLSAFSAGTNQINKIVCEGKAMKLGYPTAALIAIISAVVTDTRASEIDVKSKDIRMLAQGMTYKLCATGLTNMGKRCTVVQNNQTCPTNHIRIGPDYSSRAEACSDGSGRDDCSMGLSGC